MPASLFLFTQCTKASAAPAECEFDPGVLVIYMYLYIGQRGIVYRVHTCFTALQQHNLCLHM